MGSGCSKEELRAEPEYLRPIEGSDRHYHSRVNYTDIQLPRSLPVDKVGDNKRKSYEVQHADKYGYQNVDEYGKLHDHYAQRNTQACRCQDECCAPDSCLPPSQCCGRSKSLPAASRRDSVHKEYTSHYERNVGTIIPITKAVSSGTPEISKSLVEPDAPEGGWKLLFVDQQTQVEVNTIVVRGDDGKLHLCTNHAVRNREGAAAVEKGTFHIAVTQTLPLKIEKITGIGTQHVVHSQLQAPQDEAETQHRYFTEGVDASPIAVDRIQQPLAENSFIMPEMTEQDSIPKFIYMGAEPRKTRSRSPRVLLIPSRQSRIPVVHAKEQKSESQTSCAKHPSQCTCTGSSCCEDYGTAIVPDYQLPRSDNDEIGASRQLDKTEPLYNGQTLSNYENTRFLVEPVITPVYVSSNVKCRPKPVGVHEQDAALDCNLTGQATNSSAYTDRFLCRSHGIPGAYQLIPLDNSSYGNCDRHARVKRKGFEKRTVDDTPSISNAIGVMRRGSQRTSAYPKEFSKSQLAFYGVRSHGVTSCSTACVANGQGECLVFAAELNELCANETVEEWTEDIRSDNVDSFVVILNLEGGTAMEGKRTLCRNLFNRLTGRLKTEQQVDAKTTKAPSFEHNMVPELQSKRNAQVYTRLPQMKPTISLVEEPPPLCRQPTLVANEFQERIKDRLWPVNTLEETECPLNNRTLPTYNRPVRAAAPHYASNPLNELDLAQRLDESNVRNISKAAIRYATDTPKNKVSSRPCLSGERSDSYDGLENMATAKEWKNSSYPSSFLPPIEKCAASRDEVLLNYNRNNKPNINNVRHTSKQQSSDAALPRLRDRNSGSQMMNQHNAAKSAASKNKGKQKGYDLLVVHPPR
ncbi:unnamed protein product [Dicrocoelium dendriticum]|nr:unnamed protein product [Dicrocoelium dendriticum]